MFDRFEVCVKSKVKFETGYVHVYNIKSVTTKYELMNLSLPCYCCA